VVVQLLRVFQWKSFSGSSVVESVSFTSTLFPSLLLSVSVEEFQW